MSDTIGFAKCMQTLKRPEQTMKEFMDEFRALDQADREWYAAAFREEGINCADPVQASDSKLAA